MRKEQVTGILPNSWINAKLIDVISEAISGSGFPKEYQGEKSGEYPFAKVGDISRCFRSGLKIISSADHYVHDDVRKKLNAKIFPRGTIVFAKIGEALKSNYRVICERPMIFDNNVMGVIPNYKIIILKYLYYFLTTQDFGKFSVATAVPSIRRGDVEAIQIPIPSPNEQKRIVTKIEELFSELDKGIESLKIAREQLKVYRQAVLKYAFEGKLTAEWREKRKQIKLFEDSFVSEIQEFQKLPSEWTYISLKKVISEPKYGTSKKCNYESKGQGVLRIPNIVSGVVNSEDLKFAEFEENESRNYALQKGDILIIRSNGSVSIVGRSALIREMDESFLYAGYLIRIRPNSLFILPEFLIQVLSSHLLRTQIEKKAKSSSGVNNINANEIKSLIIPICDPTEQQEIVNQLKQKLSLVDYSESIIESELKKAEILRQSILTKAFSGQLVAQDRSDEPASILLERIRSEKAANIKTSKPLRGRKTA